MDGVIRRRGPLRPVELGSSAVLGSVAVAFVAVGSLLPRAGAAELLASVPLAIIGQRHRARALLAAAVSAAAVAFLVAGSGAALAIAACSVMAAVVGGVSRRGRGGWTVFGLSFVIGPLSGLVLDLLLTLFSAVRELAYATARSGVNGLASVIRTLPAGRHVADLADHLLNGGLDVWWVWVFVAVVAGMPVAMLCVWWLLSAVLGRLQWVTVEDSLDGAARAAYGEDALSGAVGRVGTSTEVSCVCPLPVQLRDVRFRYPGAETDSLRGMDLRLEGRQFVVVVGANGSGKSTLVRILAGAAVTAGTADRVGAVGLGQIGGTALVMQRPETQVLGMKVSDDLVWGLPPGFTTDSAAVLEAVGLAGLEDRSTDSLSGGQLQRLAVATALVRRPSLLISDESTAMVDAEGRKSLLELLAGLPQRYPMTVLHVTHSAAEAARADRVIRMVEGRIVEDRSGGDPHPPTVPASAVGTPPGRPTRLAASAGKLEVDTGNHEPLLRLDRVEHTYAYGTPWAHRALRNVDLELFPGEGLLVTGGNGSGKSTLAWVLAGLTRPTGGHCLLDGRPTADQVGHVALAFQHSRLQLQRPTVAEDILAAAGRGRVGRAHAASSADDAFVAESLQVVGLPEQLAHRSIDALSGGQMRRVALAGLLGARPRLLVLDEPLAGLDPQSRRELLATLGMLRRRDGMSLIVISHDLEDMGTACSRTAVLDNGVLAC